MSAGRSSRTGRPRRKTVLKRGVEQVGRRHGLRRVQPPVAALGVEAGAGRTEADPHRGVLAGHREAPHPADRRAAAGPSSARGDRAARRRGRRRGRAGPPAQAPAQRAPRAGVGRRRADVSALRPVVHAAQGMGKTAADAARPRRQRRGRLGGLRRAGRAPPARARAPTVVAVRRRARRRRGARPRRGRRPARRRRRRRLRRARRGRGRRAPASRWPSSPTGTANDFARALDLPLDVGRAPAPSRADPGAAQRSLDLARAGGRPFVNAASAGLSVFAARRAHAAQAAARAARLRRRRGCGPG